MTKSTYENLQNWFEMEYTDVYSML